LQNFDPVANLSDRVISAKNIAVKTHLMAFPLWGVFFGKARGQEAIGEWRMAIVKLKTQNSKLKTFPFLPIT